MTQYDPLDVQEQDREKAEKDLRAKLIRENEESDVKWMMGTKRGRRMVWRMLDQAGVFRLSFDTNPLQMSFAEGNRNAGLRFLNMIHAVAPELYPIMLKEQHDTKYTDDRRAGDE